MNLLAQVIHHLMAGQDVTELVAQLSPVEQAALTDLKTLLDRSPQALAAALAQSEPGIDWTKGAASMPHLDPPT